MQYMIDTHVFPGLFVCRQIPYILHDHDRLMIAFGIGTDRTDFLVRKRAAGVAVVNVLPRVHHNLRKAFDVIWRHIDDMERKSLCGLVSHAGKLCKLLNQFLNISAVKFHQKGNPPPSPPKPPVILPISSLFASSA